MRLAFLGSGAFGLPTLARLAERHTIVAVVTQPDRPAGRGKQLTGTPIAQWAGEHLGGTPVLKPQDVNAPGVVAEVHRLAGSADAWVVIAFGQKLGAGLLNPPGHAPQVFNLHASLLPRWRGAGPVNAAILAGDAETGNSVITIADRMDAGLVLGQSKRAITPGMTAGELHDLLAADGPDLVERVLADIATGTIRTTVQDESMVTRAPKLSKADGVLDLAQPAEACRRRINGLSPWPGVAVTFRGEPVRLLRAETAGDGSTRPPGTILSSEQGLIACGGGTTLRLLEIQPAGKRAMGFAEFARGQRVRDSLYSTDPESLHSTGKPC